MDEVGKVYKPSHGVLRHYTFLLTLHMTSYDEVKKKTCFGILGRGYGRCYERGHRCGHGVVEVGKF